jgi:hypothetical protein
MKTYEDFLIFLEEHLKTITDYIPASDGDFHPISFAIARFLLSEPYRWEALVGEWPKIPKVPKPSESELMEFYKKYKGFQLSFRKELKEKNTDVLYKAYYIFYPIFVLKDEFFTSIFREDTHARRYKKIFNGSEMKIFRVTEKINAIKKIPSFHQLMKKFTSELAGFSLTLINNKKLLDQVVDKLAKVN